MIEDIKGAVQKAGVACEQARLAFRDRPLFYGQEPVLVHAIDALDAKVTGFYEQLWEAHKERLHLSAEVKEEILRANRFMQPAITVLQKAQDACKKVEEVAENLGDSIYRPWERKRVRECAEKICAAFPEAWQACQAAMLQIYKVERDADNKAKCSAPIHARYKKYSKDEVMRWRDNISKIHRRAQSAIESHVLKDLVYKVCPFTEVSMLGPGGKHIAKMAKDFGIKCTIYPKLREGEDPDVSKEYFIKMKGDTEMVELMCERLIQQTALLLQEPAWKQEQYRKEANEMPEDAAVSCEGNDEGQEKVEETRKFSVSRRLVRQGAIGRGGNTILQHAAAHNVKLDFVSPSIEQGVDVKKRGSGLPRLCGKEVKEEQETIRWLIGANKTALFDGGKMYVDQYGKVTIEEGDFEAEEIEREIVLFADAPIYDDYVVEFSGNLQYVNAFHRFLIQQETDFGKFPPEDTVVSQFMVKEDLARLILGENNQLLLDAAKRHGVNGTIYKPAAALKGRENERLFVFQGPESNVKCMETVLHMQQTDWVELIYAHRMQEKILDECGCFTVTTFATSPKMIALLEEDNFNDQARCYGNIMENLNVMIDMPQLKNKTTYDFEQLKPADQEWIYILGNCLDTRLARDGLEKLMVELRPPSGVDTPIPPEDTLKLVGSPIVIPTHPMHQELDYS